MAQIPDLIAASRNAESMYVEWRRLHRDGMRRVHEQTVPLYQRTRHFRVYASNLVAQPNVSLGVIPFGVRRTVWPLEAFYAFDNSQVAVETLTAEINLIAPGEIGTYLKAFNELSKLAARGPKARACITRAIDSLG